MVPSAVCRMAGLSKMLLATAFCSRMRSFPEKPTTYRKAWHSTSASSTWSFEPHSGNLALWSQVAETLGVQLRP